MATGIFTKNAAFIVTIPGIAFTNSGTIIINDGTLRLSATTFTNFGNIQVAATKILDLVNTTTNLNGNTAITGSGIINLNGGTTNIQFLVQIPSGVTVNFSSGTIQGGNTLRFLNSSTMNWSGGQLTGNAKTEINAGAILNISGTVGLRANHWIENNGTINWNSAGNIVYDGGSTNSEILNNNIFNIGAATNIVNTLGGSNFFTLTNNGTITKTVGVTTLDANVNLVNSGSITVTSGTLTLNNNFGTHSGTYNNNSTINGTHAISFTGSTFTNNGLLTSTLAMAGASAQSIGGNGIINNLTINNSNNVSIAIMQRVYGVLTFISGKLLAPTSQLDLTETATLIGVSSNRYVAGNVKKRFPAGNSTFTYPVGDANYYTPVVASVYNSAPPCTLEVQSFQGDHPNFATSGLNAIKSVNRYWRIDDGGSGGYDSFDFTFNFDASDVDGGANTSNFTISKFDSPSTWTPVTSSGQASTSITATNITSFSDFQIGEPCTPTNEYRSAVVIGGWNTPGTWETYNGCAWVPATVAPDGNNSSTITIRSGFNVTNNSQNIQGDEIIIEAGATLYVSEGDLTVLDGTGDDLTILGTLQMNGGAEIIINGKVAVADGGSIDCGSQDIFTGTGILEIALNGSMNVFTNGDNFLLSGGITLNNFGEVSWSGPGGDFFMEDAAVINNSNIFTVETNNSIVSTTSGTINNLVGGTFTKSNTTTTVIEANIAWTNTGTLVIEAGTLTLTSSSGTSQGTIDVNAGATLEGSYLVYSGNSFINNGIVNLSGLELFGVGMNVSGTGSIAILIMNNNDGVGIVGQQTITNSLDLQIGEIFADGTNKLVLEDDVVITSANPLSYVVGNLERFISTPGDVEFPVGDVDNYTPVTLGPSFTVGGSVTVRTDINDHINIATSGINDTKSVNRTWTITNNSLVFSECDITFNWVPTDVDALATPANFKVAKFDGGTWTLPTVSNPTATSIYVSNVTSFSEFQVGETAGIYADYQSVLSGDWNDISIWEYWNGTAWQQAPVPPDANSGVITIRAGNVVDMNGLNIVVDEVSLEGAGSILSLINSTVSWNSGNAQSFITANASSTLNIIGSSVDGDGGTTSIGIATGANLVLSGNSTVGDGITIINNGSALVDGGGIITLGNGSAINNGGIMSVDADFDLSGTNCNVTNTGTLNFYGTHQFSGNSPNFLYNDVTGTLNVDGQLTINTQFNNLGNLVVLNNNVSNSLSLTNGNNTYTGSINVSAGATFNSTENVAFAGTSVINDGSISGAEFGFSGSTTQTYSGSGTIQNMAMYNAAGLTLNSDITVNGNMTFSNGIINANSNTFICGPAISFAVGSSSWVNGKMQHTVASDINTLFVVGDASTRGEVIVHPNGLTTPGTITVNVASGDHPDIANSGINDTKSVNKYWHIENNGTVFNDCWVNFLWDCNRCGCSCRFQQFCSCKI